MDSVMGSLTETVMGSLMDSVMGSLTELDSLTETDSLMDSVMGSSTELDSLMDSVMEYDKLIYHKSYYLDNYMERLLSLDYNP